MTNRLATLLLVAMMAACSDVPKPPPQASGEWFQINPARWAMQSTAAVERRQ